MTKAYLFVYDEQFGDREVAKGYLNRMPIVTKWRYDLPNAFYLISQFSAQQISLQLRELAGEKGKFIVTEIPPNSWGWLTPESWHLIQKHEYQTK